jgi:hypothetical protein
MKKLIPFDWDEYQKGAKPVFKKSIYGKILTIINSGLDESYPLHVIYTDESNESYHQHCALDGRYNVDEQYNLLLYKEVEEKVFYVPIYKSELTEYYYGLPFEKPFPPNEDSEIYIGALRVTYTDEDLIK